MKNLNLITRYLTRRALRRHAIPYSVWFKVTNNIPLITARSNKEKARLRLLTTLFIHKKSFTGVHELSVTIEMKITIAVQACLEILYLGLNAYDGWIEIILYPSTFVVNRDVVDSNGLVHKEVRGLSGESWAQGPVILSWQDVQHDSFQLHPGHNIVIHEFAHKLDMLSGRFNGVPPLPRSISINQWNNALGDAYSLLMNQINHQQPTYINAYAATNPAEFFAVMCEYFFTDPHKLDLYCPQVFQQLKLYFGQDPTIR